MQYHTFVTVCYFAYSYLGHDLYTISEYFWPYWNQWHIYYERERPGIYLGQATNKGMDPKSYQFKIKSWKMLVASCLSDYYAVYT